MEDGGFTDIDQANALADTVLAGLREIVASVFWKLLPENQLDLGRRFEVIARTVYAAQVHQAGEIDTQGMAAERSCTSTAALLRQAYVISVADAKARVAAARQILPRLMPTGAEAPPILRSWRRPSTMAVSVRNTSRSSSRPWPKSRRKQHPRRGTCARPPWYAAVDCDPNYLDHAAQRILDKVDPDGELDDTTRASRMELHFGTRSTRTGLTPIKGQLDDYGVEVVKNAIDGLAAPRPEQDDVPRPAPAVTRSAQALVEAMRRFLDLGDAPEQGGERPHVTIAMNWDAITGMISGASFDSGAMISPAQARKFLCDAQLIPMILGSKSEVSTSGGRRGPSPPTFVARLSPGTGDGRGSSGWPPTAYPSSSHRGGSTWIDPQAETPTEHAPEIRRSLTAGATPILAACLGSQRASDCRALANRAAPWLRRAGPAGRTIGPARPGQRAGGR